MNALGQICMGRHALDPLTRPAPAEENAGGGPPSPPRGRGQGVESLLVLPISAV
jgi:hypothetical protein